MIDVQTKGEKDYIDYPYVSIRQDGESVFIGGSNEWSIEVDLTKKDYVLRELEPAQKPLK